MAPPTGATAYLLNHVVLPPDLPQASDQEVSHEKKLIDVAIETLRDLKELVTDEHQEIVAFSIATVKSLMRNRDSHGFVNDAALQASLDAMVEGTECGIIPLDIKVQNAGVLIRRESLNIVFESFELSPVNEATMGCKGRLKRIFPAHASQIPISKMREQGFTQALAFTLAAMSAQSASEFQPQHRANTSDPGLVTDFLMNVIAAVGAPAEVTRIRKHTRDEVLSKQAYLPWRRAPLWLLLRVTLQLLFSRECASPATAVGLYKVFGVLLLSRILELAKGSWQAFGSDSLQALLAKIILRLHKLESCDLGKCLRSGWQDQVRSRLRDAHSLLSVSWTDTMKSAKANVDLAVLSGLEAGADLNIPIPLLNAFVAESKSTSKAATASGFTPTTTYPCFAADKLPVMLDAADPDLIFRLAAAERWVEKHSQAWAEAHAEDPGTCGELWRLMQAYHLSASTMYSGNPTSMSVMYLTICNIWVQCDVLACRECPLLTKYDPEIRLDELQCLSLPLRMQLKRLHLVETYVKSRRNAAVKGHTSVYREFGQPSSFAVRYFDSEQGSGLRVLLAEIKRISADKEDKKAKELEDLMRQYHELMDRYNTGECDFDTIMADEGEEDTVTTTRHNDACARCELKNQADALSISIFERPLSSDLSVAKATVFELRLPEAFGHWRDATFYVMTNVLGFRSDSPRKPSYAFGLDKHHDLHHMLSEQYSARRIIIVSTVKSHTASSKPLKAITSLQEADVCLENALKYTYYDKRQNACVDGTRKFTDELLQKCSYTLPKRSQALQRYMMRPPSAPDGPQSNEVIADQASCPNHFSIDEFKSFATVPLGREIMYENILVQLAMPSLDFAKTESQSMMQHIVHQAGPPNGQVERIFHSGLCDSRICNSLLEQLEVALQRISENWESWKALATFALLTRRILSTASSEEVVQRCLKYLIKARQVCVKWLRRLEDRAANSADQEQRSQLYLRTLDIALLGTSTFDVDDDYLQAMIEPSDTASALLHFSIKVKENQNSLKPDSEGMCGIMHQSWARSMHRILPQLHERHVRDSEGLDRAVRASWATFQSVSAAHWTTPSQQQRRWLHTTSGTLFVHFDLLTGDLLVNGLPLTRLPSQFMQHEMYGLLFGKTVLEVGPSNTANMDFSAKSTRHGYELHFGIRDHDMLVVAAKDDSRLEVLPSRLFENTLPHAFVSDYIHWYNREKDIVIFRPRRNPWLPQKEEWQLKRTGSMWQLKKGADVLVNIFSKTARIFHRIFQPLEANTHTHVTFNIESGTMDIILPRLLLEFYIRSQTTQIHSRQYRTMLVDFDQNICTLVGLASKLVLRNDQGDERMILVPLPQVFDSESVQYVKVPSSNHIDVTIAQGDATRICAYTLDATLGRIIDRGDLQSKLLLAYLHALTSHCLPDPFTSCTGTESALTILRSASIRSFESLTRENISLFALIAKLTPGRTSHAEDMQQIHWDLNLPVSSQHPGFYILVKEILEEAQRSMFFHPGCDKIEPKGLPTIKGHLQERDMIRGASFRIDGYGAENFTEKKDAHYTSRETNADPARGQRAHIAASLILRPSAALHQIVPQLKGGLFEKHLKEVVVRSTSSSSDLADLRFDTKWLGDSSDIPAEYWCSLHLFLPKAAKKASPFNIMLWLSTMAYSTTANMVAIEAIAAFYRLGDLAALKPPTASLAFRRYQGCNWVTKDIEFIIGRYKKPPSECPEARIPRPEAEDVKKHNSRVGGQRRRNTTQATKKFIAALLTQWPCSNPATPAATDIGIYINVADAMLEVKELFKAWHDNMRFNDYLDRLSAIIARQAVVAVPKLQRVVTAPIHTSMTKKNVRYFAMDRIFSSPAPILNVATSKDTLFVADDDPLSSSMPLEPAIPLIQKSRSVSDSRTALKGLCRDLGLRAILKCEKDYVKTLRRSCEALESFEKTSKVLIAQLSSDTQKLLQDYQDACKVHFEALDCALAQAVQGNSGSDTEIAFVIQHAPRISPSSWLTRLNRAYFENLSDPWKAVIIEYARAITQLHRAHRMVTLSEKPLELAQELQYAGHTNWSPWEFPETLLLEAESGILVREVQEVIAKQMSDPPGDENAVCQLNMGEGKSSVIAPILAAALADTKRLVRIIIAKPQSKQMLQVLISKLGGLLNRRVYHLPFSRELRLSTSEARTIRSICHECMANGGVILTQPEHILSFKLMAIETVLIDQQDVASALLETQQFLEASTRDIVDESDENFSPHFELVYTMGSQQAIDFAPQRWMIIQQVLGLVAKFAPQVKASLPVSIDVQDSGEGVFPRVRVLRSDATDMLLGLVARHIVDYGLTGLSTRTFSRVEEKSAVEAYITQQILTPDQITSVEGSKFWDESTKNAILLVRGLIACGILRFTLGSKRWRVNFGLDPNRTPNTLLAVPYRFKDGPNPRSEYSHPDVLILLTLLSHYYGGLKDVQMFQAFEHLSNSDQSAVQYSEWIGTASSNLPAVFRTLSGINLKDRQHCIQEIFPHLRHSKACIDYFLSRLVFPKELRQFMSKLSASGWDMGAAKTNPTTGFSGTKDTMHVLPLAVKHLDLPSQSHVNALVLGYLLDTSSVELLPPRTTSTDAEHVLAAATRIQPEVRVILDCGAAILEQSNRQVVESWLALSDPIQIHAAIYFEDNQLTVLDRTGRIESLQTSPFAKQLDVCVVYLDEANTRGTDLKLPRHYRACLTLGNALSKDKLIQGCMRMRQLGKGQSVAFLVPEEIATKIYQLTSNDFDEPITVRDVLIWSIQETWTDLKKSMPLWAVQGHRFLSHEHLSQVTTMTIEQAKEFLEDEGQGIELRYSPSIQGNKLTARSKEWDVDNPSIAEVITRCQGFGAMGTNSADLDEEQERELAPEQEEEREVERPGKMEASKHDLHTHVSNLVKNGRITKSSKAFTPAFQALDTTSAGKLCGLSQFPADVFVTADFIKTVKKPTGNAKGTYLSDSFQRMVQWVISVPDAKDINIIKNLVIISPFEANKLLPQVRNSQKVTLHLFSPRTNSSYRPLDALDLYKVGREFDTSTIPRSLIAQLNLFAGSLYLRSYEEYTELCDFLGLLHADAAPGKQIAADGFITPPSGTWGIKESPVPLLRALLMRIRKEGEGLEKTHLGKLLNGVRLEEADFRLDTEMSGVNEEVR